MVRWRRPAPGPATMAAALAAAFLLTIACPSPAATATAGRQSGEGPAADVLMAGPPRAAVAGEAFSGRLLVTPRRDGPLGGFRVEGPGWQALRWELPPEAADARRGRELAVAFTALPTDPSLPLLVAFEVGDRTVRKRLDLSREHVERVTVGQPTVAAPFRAAPPRSRADLPRPAAAAASALDKAAPDGTPDEPGDAPVAGAAGWDIRVHGWFGYVRDDGVSIGADGVTVVIVDDDLIDDDELATTVTDADGDFDVTFHWTEQLTDPDPDLYVRFRAANGEVEVEDATWGRVYQWTTGTRQDYTGTDWNLGPRQPSEEWHHAGLHILTDITRTWRWAMGFGYDNHMVEVQWPDGDDGAWYTPWNEDIHISTEREWNEDTHSHEWGHHFINVFAVDEPPDYCNGICDDDGCGHCLWCQEDSHIAWQEGFPDYLASVIPASYFGRYGVAAMNIRQVDTLQVCDTAYDVPELTEGFVAALLQDIHDGVQDDDAAYPGWADVLALSADEILAVVDLDEPLTAMGFLADFRARYPSRTEALWETAMNNGFNFDTAAPGAPTGLTSASHAVGVSSPDATVDFAWTRPTDDASGVDAYSWTFSPGGPSLPPTSSNLGNVTSATIGPISTGTWWFNLRARDRFGRWSNGYASYGPFTIREPEPANLTHELRSGWDYPLVPRDATGANASSCLVTSTLPGWMSGTYWNVSGHNTGEAACSAEVRCYLLVDGVPRTWCSWTTVLGGASFYGVNMGSGTNVPGGRHTFSAELDPYGVIPETSETDNLWGHQFIWIPEHLAAGVPVTKSSPRPSTGGWDHIVDGSTKWYNCDGFSFSTTGWWNAVVLRPTNLDNDYDLRLHAPTTGSENGFASNQGYSARGAGCLDAVLVNKNVTGSGEWNAGVLNLHSGGSSYVVQHVISYPFAFGDSVTYSLDPEDFLLLREVEITTYGQPVSVKVWTDPATSPVSFAWYEEGFDRGRLSDWDRIGQTGADGVGRMDFIVYDTGYCCLALFRDPKDSAGSLQVTLEIQATPADLMPWQAAGWHSPLVPRPLPDGTSASVPLPDVLHGDQPSTYYNLCLHNDGPSNGAPMDAHVLEDGVSTWGLHYSSFPGGATSYFNWTVGRTIRGGRHSLALWADYPQEVEEIREDNNIYGEQYVWSPLVVASGDTLHRNAPPAMTGGWDQITSGEARWYNCDGLRVQDGAEWWRAVAVMPAETCDVDIRLHEPLVGVKDGFAANEGLSGWGAGQCDYVLINDNLADPGSYDAGVLRIHGSRKYAVDVATETYLGTPSGPSGTHGPYTLPPGQILALYELRLEPDVYTFLLDSGDDHTYWGMTLHRADRAFQTKSTCEDSCIAYQNPEGSDEYFTARIEDTGYYCLAVWKALAKNLPMEGEYSLRILRGVTAAPGPDAIPTVTRLAGVRPNPCNPRAEVRFELTAPRRVDLAIYDARGRRLRELAGGEWPAGSHVVVWDGRDATGREAASGTYLVRLLAGEVREARKLTLVR